MIDLHKGLTDKKNLGRPIPETRSPIVTTCTGSGPTGARSGQCTTLGWAGAIWTRNWTLEPWSLGAWTL